VRFTVVILSLLLGQFAASAALVWEPAGQPQVVFAGQPSAIRQDIRNDGEQAATQPVRLRLMQLASSIAAPVPGWEQKQQVEIPAGQTLRTSVDISLPKVTSPTRFRITWTTEAGKLLGGTEVVGCPADLFQSLQEVSSKQPIGLLGETASLAALLRQQGCQVRELSALSDLKTFEGSLLLVAFAARTKAEPEDFGRLAAQYAKDQGRRIVWLVEPDNLSLPFGPTVCIFTHGEGTLVVSTGMKVAELSQNPLNQLRLVWLVELALASEENRLLLLGRPMNL